jgi:hypothetical protein
MADVGGYLTFTYPTVRTFGATARLGFVPYSGALCRGV